MTSTFNSCKCKVPFEFCPEASHLSIDHPRGIRIDYFKPHSLVDPVTGPSEWNYKVVISTVHLQIEIYALEKLQ